MPYSQFVTTPVLHVRDLRKSYGATRILQGLDLDLLPGERVAVMGPSGSGKSTLLTCLAGLESPDSGTITFLGQNLSDLGEDRVSALRRGRLASVFQFFHLLPTLTAAENVGFPLLLARSTSRDRNQRVRSLLKEVGLDDRAHAMPDSLSGGELQRLAIARALITKPALILADEPTGSLDADNSARILQLLQSLTQQHQTALLMVTHDPEAAAACGRRLHIRHGQLFPAETNHPATR